LLRVNVLFLNYKHFIKKDVNTMFCKFRLILFLMTATAVAFQVQSSAVSSQEPHQPIAPVREVTDDYFGQIITDPYRWMEEPKSAELADWMKAQNAFTRSHLDRLPMREKIFQSLEAQNNSIVIVSGVRRVGNRYFYFKLAPGDSDRKVYMREGLTGAEKLLVEPQKISAETGKRFSLISFSPSPDGKFLSYLASAGGAELGEIRIVETATGRELADKIGGTRWEAGAWLPDASAILYVRFPELVPNAPPTERYQKRKVYLHKLGDQQENDRAVFGYGVNAGVELDPKLLTFPSIPFGSKYVVMIVNTGVSPNSAFYLAPVESLKNERIPWRKVVDFNDEVGSIEASGAVASDDDLYLLTYKNAARYKVVKTSLQNPDLKNAKTVIEAGEAVLTRTVATRDALYVQQNDGGIGRLLRVDYKTDKVEKLNLPYDGTISNLTADPRESNVIFAMDSWVKAPGLFVYDASKKTITDTGLQPPSKIDTSAYESVQVKVKAADGTLIPLSIFYKKGLKRDGRNLTGMSGYGAYGISSEPRFVPRFFPWLDAGGVVAHAHVRGGGEYGEEWHRAGFKATKPNTWRDFIACAEYLIKEKYTSPEYLAGHGASAGGILIGNAIAERPDLFGAAIINVGLNNMLRYETTANGVPNIPEYGTVKNEADFKNLLAMDAFHKIKPGVKYPAVMLTHGINDPRVEPWLSAKMAARLQAATASSKPILLRIDYDAGHGIGNSRRQMNEEFADIFAFLFEQLSEKNRGQKQGDKVLNNSRVFGEDI
jgi:prolyl oligopeptidase